MRVEQTGEAGVGWAATLRALWRHGRLHLRFLAGGAVGALGVVLLRLALPWPLRGVVEVVFPGRHSGRGRWMLHWIPDGVDPVVALCVAYVVLAALAGLFEMLLRVCLARFGNRTVNGLRQEALATVRRDRRPGNPAELIACVVGDAARLKASLKGFLVHASQNVLLVVGVTVLFLWISPELGLLFLLSALLAVWVGWRGAGQVREVVWRQRRTEARYAARVHDAALSPGTARGAVGLEAKAAKAAKAGRADEDLNRKSARRAARASVLVWRQTALVQTAVAGCLAFALGLGAWQVRHGQLAPGELFLFIAYALTVHRRAVRVGREVVRAGKIEANARRLLRLVKGPATPAAPLPPLGEGIRLAEVTLAGLGRRRKQPRLGPIDLTISAGARIAVLGPDGAGKSSLLAVLAGEASPSSGRVLWGGAEVTDRAVALRDAVWYLAEEPALSGVRVRDCLGLQKGEELPVQRRDALRALGALRVVRRLSGGVKARLHRTPLSVGERRALALAAATWSSEAVWLLDTPVLRNRARDRSCLDVLLDLAGPERAVVVAMPVACRLKRFDRVVVLKAGRVAFEGAPADWRAWRSKRKAKGCGGAAATA